MKTDIPVITAIRLFVFGEMFGIPIGEHPPMVDFDIYVPASTTLIEASFPGLPC